jgi:hypothetical protein
MWRPLIILLFALAWTPVSADLYMGRDAAGVLIVTDKPFAGGQLIARTPPPAAQSPAVAVNAMPSSTAPTDAMPQTPPGKSFTQDD